MKNQPKAPIRAAGGVIWRTTPQGKQIAIIYRNRYGDWTLPKGKLKGEESWREAARREVGEETGLIVRLGDFAGALAYEVEERPKVVCFWHMTVAGETRLPLDKEVRDMAWVSVAEALQRLDYPLERALLEVWAQENE